MLRSNSRATKINRIYYQDHYIIQSYIRFSNKYESRSLTSAHVHCVVPLLKLDDVSKASLLAKGFRFTENGTITAGQSMGQVPFAHSNMIAKGFAVSKENCTGLSTGTQTGCGSQRLKMLYWSESKIK